MAAAILSLEIVTFLMISAFVLLPITDSCHPVRRSGD